MDTLQFNKSQKLCTYFTSEFAMFRLSWNVIDIENNNFNVLHEKSRL
jgi:hypothetical protein